MIQILPTSIVGPTILEPKIFKDARGYFFESFHMEEFRQKVLEPLEKEACYKGISRLQFVQDNESMSSYAVVRGLHFQCPPFTQSKLVRCVLGSVLDVAVDIRVGSPTYGQSVAVELSADNHRQFFIPKGFAHGFSVLSEKAIFQYKCDAFYAPQSEGGVCILDDQLSIDWRIPKDKMILSEKDVHNHPMLANLESPFDFHKSLYE